MLEVKPIQTKAEQEAYCYRCNIPYDADMMAYGAFEDGHFLGMCQFTLREKTGFIKNLVEAEGISDWEAMFIMARGTMNFIDLCGVHACECAPDAASETMILGLGFQRQPDGRYYADMTHFFDGGNCASKKKPEAAKKPE